MTLEFETAIGSVPGTHHTRAGRNNQDAACGARFAGGVVAVVCDGCGSGLHSEVGAKLGARLIAQDLAGRAGTSSGSELLARTHEAVSTALMDVAVRLGNDLAAAVEEYFLFTTLGAIVSPVETTVFALGDGLYAINGDVRRLGPFPGNAPPYLGYSLLSRMAAGHPSACDHFEIVDRVPTSDLHSLVLGTDGAFDLSPTMLARLWTDDRFFRNPDALRRFLAKLNDPAKKIDWNERRVVREPEAFHDDVTLAVIRRRM